MARKTIRVEIPVKKPNEFSKLLKKISEQHTTLGNASPLANNLKVDMNDFENKRNNADQKRSDAEKLRAQSEQAMKEAQTIYGTAKGQTINTPGTLYNMVGIIRDILLVTYKDNEEELSKWGFNVVIGQARSPKRKPKGS